MADNGNDDDRTRSFVQLTAGTSVSHYSIVSKIGAGGMGEIYLADDTRLKRKVALKFLPHSMCGNQDYIKRFAREAEAAALFSHPNIVAIHDVGEFTGRPYVVLDYVEGMSLRNLIEKRNLPFSQVLDIGIQICSGLDCAHRAGVIHRDLKPSNILVDKESRVRIADFGLAVIEDSERLTDPAQMVGTVGYISPEQIAGKTIDERTDIFSLGIVLYELMTGVHPFHRANPSATLNAICNEEPAPLRQHRTNVPGVLQEIVSKALDKDRKLRYQHIDELMTDLLRTQSGSARARPVRETMRKYKLLGITAILLLIVAISSSDSRRFFINLLTGPPVSEETHLAVLPIVDLTDSSWGRLFCAGLRETMTSSLTRMKHLSQPLWVVPASEVTDRKVESVRDAKKSLGANMIFTSSLQKVGENVRLVLNLIDAESERQINSELIDLDTDKLQELQDSTVSKMASMLQLSVEPSDRSANERGNTSVPEAYNAYLLGRGHLQRYDRKESVDSAIAQFTEAVSLDSKYALAYSGLGEAYWRKYKLTNDPDLVSVAIGNSRAALAMNDNLPEVHLSLGRIYRGLRQFENAITEYNTVLSLSPGDYVALRGMARSLEELGHDNEAESYYQKVINLRPLYWAGYLDMALFHIYGNRFEKAEPLLEKSLELVPQSSPDLNDIGAAYILIGDTDRAIATLQRSVGLEPTYAAYSNIGYLHFMKGEYEEAAAAYEQALAINPNDHAIWCNLGTAYTHQQDGEARAAEAYRHAIIEAKKRLLITPDDPLLIASLAEYYAATHDTTRAEAMADSALKVSHDDAEVLVRLVFAMEDIGDRKSSIEYLNKAIDLGYRVDELESFPSKQDLLSEKEVLQHLGKSDFDSEKDH